MLISPVLGPRGTFSIGGEMVSLMIFGGQGGNGCDSVVGCGVNGDRGVRSRTTIKLVDIQWNICRNCHDLSFMHYRAENSFPPFDKRFV